MMTMKMKTRGRRIGAAVATAIGAATLAAAAAMATTDRPGQRQDEQIDVLLEQLMRTRTIQVMPPAPVAIERTGQQTGQQRTGQARGQRRAGRGEGARQGGGRRGAPPVPVPPREMTVGNALVNRLDFDRFKANIRKLASFGTRYWHTQGNADARDWIQAELESYCYTVERHKFTASSRGTTAEVDSVYATKIGTKYPDQMYIVSGHMDSYNTESQDQSFAPGANDDGSGTSLVMEAARIFAGPDVQTEYSIRFILWNCEEIGRGARAYVLERWDKQGVEDPPGSGRHPEPKWLGMIQHDMMLFDHGMPAARGERPSENQDPRADVDIEYQARGTFGGKALELAAKLFVANAQYATDYPAEIGQNMSNTDSSAFINYCPAISLRENQRIAEIGRGADPQWHKNSDVFETYKDEDFRLGFNAMQMTVGAVAELAVASGPPIPTPASTPPPAEPSESERLESNARATASLLTVGAVAETRQASPEQTGQRQTRQGQGQRRGERGQGVRRGGGRQSAPPPPAPPRERTDVNTVVDRLDFDRFKANIQKLASFGTRYWNTQGNADARDWIQAEMESYGYKVERLKFTPSGNRAGADPIEVDSVYATKIGATRPNEMYIVSAHMDSFNTESRDNSFAPGANDDGSGTSLVMEMARVYASPDARTDASVRFILWNCEEIGLLGARAYVEQRAELQGREDPPGSGLYPEPKWLGVIQHDMMLFDHGMPSPQFGGGVNPVQIREADVDIEYDADTTYGGRAQELAARLLMANAKYATDYPAEVGQFMQSTDSVPFAGHAPSISLRENERRDQIGRGADPQWHKNSDAFETYSEADFRLGFNAMQMTAGAVGEMSGLRLTGERR